MTASSNDGRRGSQPVEAPVPFDRTIHNPLGTRLDRGRVLPGDDLQVWVSPDSGNGRPGLMIDDERLAEDAAHQLVEALVSALNVLAIVRTCPPWCAGGHTEADLDNDGSVVHMGPEFGRVTFSGITEADGRLRELAAETTGRKGRAIELVEPRELRKLASDALAAADWLDTQR